MRGLEASVTRPETANSRGLQVLNDRAVGENEAADVDSYCNQRRPADERMKAQ
jgi:hypothetical protein